MAYTEPDKNRTQEIEQTAPKHPPSRVRQSVQTFVAEQNVSRFIDRFSIAHDAYTRQTVQKLLLEEENGLGFNSEQLDRTQRCIKDCNARIEQHERLIHKARLNGHDVATAERVLSNLIEIQEVLWSHLQVIIEALNRSKL